MSKAQEEQIRILKRTVWIAADMFREAGYVTPSGNESTEAIRRFLLSKAREELRGTQKE